MARSECGQVAVGPYRAAEEGLSLRETVRGLENYSMQHRVVSGDAESIAVVKGIVDGILVVGRFKGMFDAQSGLRICVDASAFKRI